MITNETIKLFGVAGAGKTTKCLSYIMEFLRKGYDINDICFTTYTKAGIKSIKLKLEEQHIYLNPYDNYIRTMNSLTWRLSGFGEDNKIKPTSKKNFFDKIRIKTESEEEDKQSEMDIVCKIYNDILNSEAEYIRNLPDNKIYDYINKYWEEYNIEEFDKEHCKAALRSYEEWKNKHNYKDYIDSIIECYVEEIDVPVKILFVDEAQDLSTAQYKLIDLWTKKYDKEIFVIAGDDDQTVHEWAGAKPDYMIRYTNNNLKTVKLENSYRLPVNIAKFCNEILKKIDYREPKNIYGLKQEGKIRYLATNNLKIQHIIEKNKDKECFLLFRTNRIMEEISNILFQNTNIPFSKINGQETKWSNKFMKISNALNKIDRGLDITKQEAKTLFSVLPSKECLKHGVKSKIAKEKEDKIYSTEELLSMTKRWRPQRDLDYYNNHDYVERSYKEDIINFINYSSLSDEVKRIRQNIMYHEKLRSINKIYQYSVDKNKKDGLSFNFNIKVGTFHQSKGLECDNVFVFMGTSYFFRHIDDSEKRCFYVACSRAKENLYLVSSFDFDMGLHKPYLEEYFEDLLLDYSKGQEDIE